MGRSKGRGHTATLTLVGSWALFVVSVKYAAEGHGQGRLLAACSAGGAC